MITAKRKVEPPYNSGSIRNYSRHLHQMTFKGIIHTDNIFDVDPTSFKNANNVYIDKYKTLVSRLPIVPEAVENGYVVTESETIETPIVETGYTLVDLFETGKVTIYVTKNSNNEYRIIARNKISNILKIVTELVTEYHITAIEKYVIVFNNVDAVILNVNDYDAGWQLLRDLSYIPITKRIVGQETFENPVNALTSSYKEQYIWSNEVNNILPDGDAEVSIANSLQSLDYTLEDAKLNTEFRLLRRLNTFIEASDHLTVATNETTGITVMAISRVDHVLLSFDYGVSFERVVYPANQGYLGIGSVSKDALNYFFVAQEGVYRYTIDTKEWTIIRVGNSPEQTANTLSGYGSNNTSCFVNAEVFSFILYREEGGLPIVRVYFKGPNLQANGTPDNSLTFMEWTNVSNPLAQPDMTRQDISLFTMCMPTVESEVHDVIIWLPGMTSNTSYLIQIFGNRQTTYTYTVATWNESTIPTAPEPVDGATAIATDTGTIYIYDANLGDWTNWVPVTSTQNLNIAYGLIRLAKPLPYDSINDKYIHPTRLFEMYGIELNCTIDNGGVWKDARTLIGKWYNTDIDPNTLEPYGWQEVYTDMNGNLNTLTFGNALGIPVTQEGAPLSLSNGYISHLTTISVDGIIDLPTIINDNEWPGIQGRSLTVVNNNSFYMRIGNSVYTNNLTIANIATLTYTRLGDVPYTEVPNVTHVDNELYMAFDNVLRITSNYKNGSDIEFNLPIINDHGFTSNINGLINISTSQVAVFLLDEIFIVAKVSDELFGYRYDYLNTRLSVGIRPGDSVINTADGVYTLYPTNQGLAVMNYQPDVATTDQIVEYVTDNITDIWKTFYANGRLKMTQVDDYIYFANGTTNYLILDLRNMSWWQFTSPILVNELFNIDNRLYIVKEGLYVFDENYSIYKDLYTTFINWQIESQPLHFNIPTHYKNIRQLIFQFKQSSDIKQTLNTQIKLYRKTITVREPEVVSFKIEDYGTIVKRFNYWKINELQWGLSADPNTTTPARLQMNGISIKYEQGEEVR